MNICEWTIVNTSDDHLARLIEVARAYYLDHQTQAEIARSIGISRSMVSRDLAMARDMGVVEIRIHDPRVARNIIAQRLLDVFPHLLDVVIAPVFSDSPDAIRTMIGRVAANFLSSHLQPGQRLVLGCGRTLRALVDALPKQPIQGLEIVQAMGNIGHDAHGIDYNEIARQAAEALGGRVFYVSAPAILGNRAGSAPDFIDANPVLKHALALTKQADVMVVGLGSLESDQLYAQAGLIEPEEFAALHGHAVGDICGRFFDQSGVEVIAPFADRTIGIELHDLRQTRLSIGVAGGTDKIGPLLGALRGEYINVLISDELTINGLIDVIEDKSEEVD
jgi:deoxyribonucleoside regulator